MTLISHMVTHWSTGCSISDPAPWWWTRKAIRWSKCLGSCHPYGRSGSSSWFSSVKPCCSHFGNEPVNGKKLTLSLSLSFLFLSLPTHRNHTHVAHSLVLNTLFLIPHLKDIIKSWGQLNGLSGQFIQPQH